MVTPVKLGIVGAAGTGKSSLARALSNRLGLKVLQSKVITADILKRDGYDFTSGMQIERFLANTGRQNEMLRRTMELEDGSDSFVTDRTVIDLAAYIVAEMYGMDSSALKHLIDTCQRRSSFYTHGFLCPWQWTAMVGNCRRTLNPWYQFKIHLLETGIMSAWGVRFIPVLDSEIEKRVDSIVAALGASSR